MRAATLPLSRRARRCAGVLAFVLASGGAPAAPATAETPAAETLSSRQSPAPEMRGDTPPETLQDIHFAVCPCWPTAIELVEEVEYYHSDISFACYFSAGLFAVEISAYSSGAGGPFQSDVSTPQPRAMASPRCRHIQTQPQVHISASEQLKTASQRAACVSVVTDAATRLGCTD